MTMTIEQRIERLRVRLDELGFWTTAARINLDEWTFDGMALQLGAAWPRHDGIVHLEHPTVTIPPTWNLEDSRLEVSPGGEGRMTIRYGSGAYEAFGLDPYHRRVPLREPSFGIEIQAVARFPFGVPNHAPRLEFARLALVDPAVERLVRMLRLIIESANTLAGHEAVIPLIEAAEEAFTNLDWPSFSPDYLSRTAESSLMQSIWQLPAGLSPHPPPLTPAEHASVVGAIAGLEQRLEQIHDHYPPQGSIRLSGHAHIDLAWLWPMEETRRKAQRTFSSVISLLDRYPDLYVNQSSAQLYAFLEQDDPALYNRVVEHVASGRWEPIGGMWVEPDMVMTAGESIVRQLLYGQRYFERAFGSAHSVAWLPDCFGFSPALPQLLRSAGINDFFTIKLNWSETNRFPYDLFLWEGLDGSRVLAHMFDNPDETESGTGGYNGNVSPSATFNTWRQFRGKYRYPQTLLSVGYGDGGGGVTSEMVERARELDNFPVLPATKFGRVDEFFTEASAAADALPVWFGELYLELHRGTLTSQGKVKYFHRRAERDLVAAEVTRAAATLGGAHPPNSLEPLWRILLRNEFHDILPGSSIREVYEVAEAELAAVMDAAAQEAALGLREIAERVVVPGDQPGLLVFNPDLSARPVRLETPASLPGSQAVEGGFVLTSRDVVPGIGSAVLLGGVPQSPAQAHGAGLENDHLRIDFGEDGTIQRVLDKRLGRDVLSGRGNQLWAYVDKPRKWDAWDIEEGYGAHGEEITSLESLEIIEDGPHRAAIRVIRHFRNSRITQDVRLWANSDRIEFRTTLDWHDRHWLLKARFPVAVRSPYATFETAFGVVQRPTHRNTSWEQARFEVAAHRFVDLSEPGYGVALLNDGKYGHDVQENEIGISLLRAPAYPDPLADEGTQSFTYALLPHAGNWTDGNVLMEAEDLNRPLHSMGVNAAEQSYWQPIQVRNLPLGLGTLKVLEDGGGLILRAYEPQGARGKADLTLPPEWRIEAEATILERAIGPADTFFHPFQVHSWILKPLDDAGGDQRRT
jgi:alpha-mannosidase